MHKVVEKSAKWCILKWVSSGGTGKSGYGKRAKRRMKSNERITSADEILRLCKVQFGVIKSAKRRMNPDNLYHLCDAVVLNPAL